MFRNHLHHIVFCIRTFIRPEHRSSGDAVRVQEGSRTSCSIDVVSFLVKHLAGIQQIDFRLGSAGREQNGLFRNLVTGCNQGIQQCFIEVVSQATYFTGRWHVYSQYWVGILQAGEWELRSFYPNPVNVERQFVRTYVRSIQHDAGSRFDKVALQYFWYKREATWSTQVTFDYLHIVVLSQELDVERTGDIEFFGNLSADFLNLAGSSKIDVLCREDKCRITRVYTGKFDVFWNSIFHDFTVLCHSIEFYFLGFLHELWYNYRIFFWYLAGHLQEAFQFFLVVAYVHGCTTQYVWRTNQYRITYFLDKVFHIVQAGQFLPSRLVDAQLVKHSWELVAVFSTVNRNRRGTQYRNRLAIEFHGQVVRNLTTYRNDDAARLFQIDDVEYAFEWQFVEVQAVAHVVVSRNRFRVVVNHDRLVA